MEYRFRDKEYLSNYMLDTKLFDGFNFLVKDVVPIRSVYILNTNEGDKILKKIDYSLDELYFIYDNLNIIREKYPYIINYRLSIDKNPYIIYEGGTYVVLDVIDGRECMFENPVDLRNSAAALARLHIAGNNVKDSCSIRNNLLKLPIVYKNRIKDMEYYSKIADMHVFKSSFDELYLEYVNYYLECATKALKHIQNSNYNEICKRNYTLCHHDLAHHNVLIGNDDNIYFLDFDYSIIDIPCHDIANMIIKAVKHTGWNNDSANNILDAYMTEYKLGKDELNIIYGYMAFPEDFYDIATGYYLRTRRWEDEEFLDKLRRKAEYKEDRDRFLNEFYIDYI